MVPLQRVSAFASIEILTHSFSFRSFVSRFRSFKGEPKPAPFRLVTTLQPGRGSVARDEVFARYLQFCMDIQAETTSRSGLGRLIKQVFPKVPLPFSTFLPFHSTCSLTHFRG